jgi:hypothetical protein
MALLSAGVPAAGGELSRTDVLLGKKGLLPYGIGWGAAHPKVIYNGGDPNGRAWKLHWSHWGAGVTHARGRTWIFRPHGGYYAKPGAIELRASRIRRCTTSGPRAYTRLHAREAVRPGGPLGHWFAWGGWKSICTGP